MQMQHFRRYQVLPLFLLVVPAYSFLRNNIGGRQRTFSKCEEKLNKIDGLDKLRKEYSKQGLSEESIPSSPFVLFSTWFNEAIEAKLTEPNAMCLSTSINNHPSARIVLLKAFDDRGFVYFTNFNSRKAEELRTNPYVALTFLWADLV